MFGRRKLERAMISAGESAMLDIQNERNVQRVSLPPSDTLVAVGEQVYALAKEIVNAHQFSDGCMKPVIATGLRVGSAARWSAPAAVTRPFWTRFGVYVVLGHLTVPNVDWLYGELSKAESAALATVI